MANDLTPANMLREYRRQSDDATREQAELFKSLSASDQREMLFYMISHAFKGLQYVHSRVDPVSARTSDFSVIKTDTQ